MEELLKALILAFESEERSYWYTHGNEVEQRAAAMIVGALKRVSDVLIEEEN